MFEDLCDVTLSINFNKSDDSEHSELIDSPPNHKPNAFSVKCFKCYGRNNKIIQTCKQCAGKSQISSRHALAELFSQIISKKLAPNSKESHKQQRQIVYTIKEEEQDIEDKKIMCSICMQESQSSVYFCKKCPCFSVCMKCSASQFHHEHGLSKSITINSQVTSQEDQDSEKQCFHCNNHIENCYSACKTCEKAGRVFQLCGGCSDDRQAMHDPMHNFDVRIYMKPQKPCVARNETYSQDLISQQDDTSDKKLKFDDDNGYDQGLNVFGDGEVRLSKRNSSINGYLSNSGEMMPSLKQSVQVLNSMQMKNSILKLQVDGLFSSLDITSELKSSKQLLGILPVSQRYLQEEEQCSSPIFLGGGSMNFDGILAVPSTNQSTEYIFLEYKCDSCSCEPIRNVRYHCRQCEDYDVCQVCFHKSSKRHIHEDYDKIDGREIRKRAKIRLLQSRDLNFKNCAEGAQRRRLHQTRTLVNSGIPFYNEGNR